MTVTKKIEQELKNIPDGKIFRYNELPLEPDEFEAAAQALSRLVRSGRLTRAAKGAFYKPEQTVLGILPPTQDEFLRPYLFKNGRRYAYITGMSLYNVMGLTTQFAFTITLASPSRLKEQTVGRIKIRTVKTYAEVTDENYIYLGFLDSLKDFNRILDIDKKSAVKVLQSRLKSFSSSELETLIEYALKYPPRVRAFLGALLENIGTSTSLLPLKMSCSAFSQFKIYITPKILPTATKWHLK